MQTTMAQALSHTTLHQNVRVVRMEPHVKSAETCKLFNRGVTEISKTGKTTDPTCYDAHVGSKQEQKMDYAKHIARICKIEDIEIVPHSKGRAWRRKRRVGLRPVKTAITYAIALHEIGHILGPRQNSTRLDKEVGAWEWAQANALEWTEAMTATRSRCLQSYLRWSKRRNGVKLAPADHPIHILAA